MILLDGKRISAERKKQIALQSDHYFQTHARKPHLAALLIGTHPASEVYVASKIRSCEEVGFKSTLIRMPGSVTEREVIRQINEWNANPAVDGILVQLPLPPHIREDAVTLAISAKKDVDGFHPMNVGRMALNLPTYISATPLGILTLLAAYQIDTEGKKCVVVGRSHIVGSPMSILMSRPSYPGNSTVTLCHSKTHDLSDQIRQADLLIVAIGKPEFVTGEMIKAEAVVIDVGMNRIEDSSRPSGTRLVGDVHFPSVAPRSSYITPVPGGVGLMTITGLLENTLLAAEKKIYG